MLVLVTNVCEYTGPAENFQGAWQALYIFPVQLTQLLLPAMKQARQGRLVFVTSARHMQPEPGFAVATSIRAASTAFAQALAREAAPHQIQVNVVEPNYLCSEAYYPRATFLDTEEGRASIAARVPMGRLSDPEDIGALWLAQLLHSTFGPDSEVIFQSILPLSAFSARFNCSYF